MGSKVILGITNVAALLTLAFVLIATFTPAWVHFGADNTGLRGVKAYLCQCMDCECGLWVSCGSNFVDMEDDCQWYLADSPKYNWTVEEKLPDWSIAVQALFACGLATTIVNVATGIIALWGFCYSCDTFRVPVSLSAISFVLLTLSIVVYAIKANFEVDAKMSNNTGEFGPIFGWSFWIGVLSCLTSFVTTICYILVRRREKYY